MVLAPLHPRRFVGVPDGGYYGTVRVVLVRTDRPRFLRGDANGDGVVDLSDGLKILEELLLSEEPACAWAEDLNQDGSVNISDGVQLFQLLFVDEYETIPPPYPDCGIETGDNTVNQLGCDIPVCP